MRSIGQSGIGWLQKLKIVKNIKMDLQLLKLDLQLFGGILKSITQMLSWPPMKKIILLKTKKIAISKTIIWWYFEVYTTN